MSSKDKQFEMMTTAPVGSLILGLAVPSMITTLITSIYNLADTFFVGRIGTSATAAVGVVFSVNMFLMALTFWAGTGGSTLVSNFLGAEKREEADRTASTAFIMSLCFGVLVALISVLGGNPLLRFLGATDTILPYARTYLRIIAIGIPFFAGSLTLGQCLRAEGLSKESMVGQVSGGILNMILDPIFIFGFRGGIAGAALATSISQIISFLMLYSYYFKKKTIVTMSIRMIARRKEDYVQLFTIGFPSLCRHGSNMIANIVLNSMAGGWGDAAIAAMSICSRLLYLSNAVSNGMNQGSQPVIGYAYGQKNYKRVKEAFWFVAKTGSLSMLGFAVVGIAFAPGLISVFRDDPEVIAVGTVSLRLICLALPFASFAMNSNGLFQMVKNPKKSSALIVGRQITVYVPLLLILPRMLDLLGLQLAGPIADVLISIVSLFMVKKYFENLF